MKYKLKDVTYQVKRCERYYCCTISPPPSPSFFFKEIMCIDFVYILLYFRYAYLCSILCGAAVCWVCFSLLNATRGNCFCDCGVLEEIFSKIVTVCDRQARQTIQSVNLLEFVLQSNAPEIYFENVYRKEKQGRRFFRQNQIFSFRLIKQAQDILTYFTYITALNDEQIENNL